MSISPGKRAAQRLFRKEQSFDLSPPRCGRCVHYVPDSVTNTGGDRRYTPPYCSLGDINVYPRSLCDAWRDRKTNETLEKT